MANMLITGRSRLTGFGVCIIGDDSQAPRHPRNSSVLRGWYLNPSNADPHLHAGLRSIETVVRSRLILVAVTTRLD